MRPPAGQSLRRVTGLQPGPGGRAGDRGAAARDLRRVRDGRALRDPGRGTGRPDRGGRRGVGAAGAGVASGAPRRGTVRRSTRPRERVLRLGDPPRRPGAGLPGLGDRRDRGHGALRGRQLRRRHRGSRGRGPPRGDDRGRDHGLDPVQAGARRRVPPGHRPLESVAPALRSRGTLPGSRLGPVDAAGRDVHGHARRGLARGHRCDPAEPPHLVPGVRPRPGLGQRAGD